MLKISFDCHTHTVASGHAYSTLEENLVTAADLGLQGLIITDHGPAMPGGPHEMNFMNLHALPKEYRGLKLLTGVEANIIDYEGNLDLPDYPLRKLDFCIASYHEICITPVDLKTHTEGWLAIIANDYVDLLGHPGRGRFPFDLDEVIKACGRYGKAIEINNNTLTRRTDRPDCHDIALKCKQYQVPVMVNSDAHFSSAIGKVDRSIALLEEINFPPELIANRNLEALDKFFQGRGKKFFQ